MELPADARVGVLNLPSRYYYAFAAIGEGEDTQVIGHGTGPSEAEAVAAIEPCSRYPQPKAAKEKKSRSKKAK